MEIKTIIFLAIIVLVIIWVISTRNKFQRMHIEVQNAQSTISNYIEQRKRYMDDALGIARISYAQEVQGIEKLTANDQYNQLRFLGEKYPELTQSPLYQEAITKAYPLGREIAASKTLLNGNINMYNQAIGQFPANIVALIFGFKRETFIDEENMAENKKVDRSEVNFDKYMP